MPSKPQFCTGSLLPAARLCAFPTDDTRAMAAGVCFPYSVKTVFKFICCEKTPPSVILSLGDIASHGCSLLSRPSRDRHLARSHLLALIDSGVLNVHRQAFVCSFGTLFREHLGWICLVTG